ncbi:MAG TPA: TetR/AcrR family transcriptional regulator [Symbiobacteriaceae bacterium]
MPPRSADENQRIREERREQILNAGAQVFSRKGLAATRIAEVAAAAGTSHGLVYHYFSSKEDLFAALVERALGGAMWVAQGAHGQPGTPWDRLHWMLSLMLGGVREQPELFLVMIQAVTSDAVPQPTREMAIRQAAVSREAVVRLIAEGQAAGQVAPGRPEQFAMILLAAIQGLAIGAAADPGLLPAFPDAGVLLSMFKP